MSRTRLASIAAACLFGLSLPAFAQPLPQAQKDSGWVALFDGTTLNGLYSSLGGKAPDTTIAIKPDGTFSVRSGTIFASGNPTGHIATKKKFSHYKVRVRIRFDKLGDLQQNAGMLYHVQESAPKLFGAYPRSIEYQGQKRGIGEVWTIGNVYINTWIDPASSARKYKEGGTPVTHGNPNGRQCMGSSAPWDDAGWNLMEAVVRERQGRRYEPSLVGWEYRPAERGRGGGLQGFHDHGTGPGHREAGEYEAGPPSSRRKGAFDSWFPPGPSGSRRSGLPADFW
jgi:hypothetical protein